MRAGCPRSGEMVCTVTGYQCCMLPPMGKFSIFDYLVIGIYLASMVVMGVLFSGRQKSLKEYFHAGGNLPWWAVGISLIATHLSPISYLALPGWIFERDTRSSITGGLIEFLMVLPTAALWIPIWARLRVLSIYEYLERRFHPAVRSIGAILFIVYTVFWLSTALVAASKGFESVSGFDGRLCLLVIGLLGAFYTVLGGMRAVIWTDVVQYVVFVGGYLMIAIVLLSTFDPMEIWTLASNQISERTGHPHTKLISHEWSMAVEGTIWVLLSGSLVRALAFGTNQITVQRLHATRDRRTMFKALLANAVTGYGFVLFTVPVAWGFVAYYSQHPELKREITHPDMVLPHFVLLNLPLIMRSLVMGGVLAALMSTFDSALNSMSNVTNNDFYRRYLEPDRSEGHYVRVAKLLTLGFGLVLLGFALSQYDQQRGTAGEHFTRLTSLVSAPIGAFFVLGILSRRVNTPGVLCGAVAAIALSLGFNGLPPMVQPVLNKTTLFTVESGVGDDLDKGVISGRLARTFRSHGIVVRSDAAVLAREERRRWQIRNGELFYFLDREGGVVTVAHEPISWMWIPVLSMVLNLLVGYLASFLFTRPPPERLAGLTLRG